MITKTMKKILTLDKVSLNYQTINSETKAVNNLSFTVNDGEFVAIIGPSGCGKTSILSLITGLIKASSGKIYMFDEEVVEPSKRTAYMLQKDHLFPWLTIEKNIILPLDIKKNKNQENLDYANDLLKKYGLFEFKKYYPKQLSGGMRQRVALIRTLTQKPDILLLDEPFSALDFQTRLSVCDDVYKIIKSERKTAILVTHDISEAISLADKIIVLSKRPAEIIDICETDIDKTLLPLKRRETPAFSKWFERLWGELNL